MRSVWAEYSTFSISDEVGLWCWAEYSTFSISDEVGLWYWAEYSTFSISDEVGLCYGPEYSTFSISDEVGLWYWAEYSTFSISDEVGLYQLTVDGYSGDAGNALADGPHPNYVANGKMFTTLDIDSDGWGSGNCAIALNGGWWYGWCSISELNQDNDGQWSMSPSIVDVRMSCILLKLD